MQDLKNKSLSVFKKGIELVKDKSIGSNLAGPFICGLPEVAKKLTAEGKEFLLEVKTESWEVFLADFPEDICFFSLCAVTHKLLAEL